jgi:hypothetical protein
MRFRTEVDIPSQQVRINYSTPVMFIGSCFAGEMAALMKEGLMPVLSNPSGVVYNPFSVSATLRNMISGKLFTRDDLYFHNGRWLSFAHYTMFSSDSIDRCLEMINMANSEASIFLRKASFLFVTFGTARIYRRKDTGDIVSNCHKIPSSFFEREMPGPHAIAEDWSRLLGELRDYNPSLSVIFTVSPVRHWKDGAHGNQVSKSVLFVAIEELLKHPSSPSYFPSYEIVLDDLRDYRFYADDLLHPSTSAVDYIWEKFCKAYLDKPATSLWQEISDVTRATGHKPAGITAGETARFASGMLERIATLESRNPGIDFSPLRGHFEGLT